MNYDINHFKPSYKLWNIQAGCSKKAVDDVTFLMALVIYIGGFLLSEVDLHRPMGSELTHVES